MNFEILLYPISFLIDVTQSGQDALGQPAGTGGGPRGQNKQGVQARLAHLASGLPSVAASGLPRL